MAKPVRLLDRGAPVHLLDTAPIEERLDYWKRLLDWIAGYIPD
jgi:hypothetical protein